jgi:hypothetical protein
MINATNRLSLICYRNPVIIFIYLTMQKRDDGSQRHRPLIPQQGVSRVDAIAVSKCVPNLIHLQLQFCGNSESYFTECHLSI